ncbi:hypothetical protein ACQR3P_28730 [Rhodococcus sp. IEGM1300]
MSTQRTIRSLEEENYYLSEKVHDLELKISSLTRQLNAEREKGQRRYSVRRILMLGREGVR